MADVTKWNKFWFEVFHPRKAQEERIAQIRKPIRDALEKEQARLNPDLPEGFHFKYALSHGFPMVYLMRDDRRIPVAQEMVHGGDTRTAVRKLKQTAKFIHDNNVET